MEMYYKSVRIHEYTKMRDEIAGFNSLLKAIARLFHKHAVPLDSIDMALSVIGEHLHAEYNGYGDAFELTKEGRR
ncbi:MAG: hypothetical protein IJF49_08295 [Clostridia bacterium]|nr:hypothetical protein [Clostridia bacterium]